MKKTNIIIWVILTVLVTASEAPADLLDGLEAYYPFNGDANDATGNGHDGTVYGGALLTTNRFGGINGAYRFDGTNDYIAITNTSDFEFSGSSFSIAAWIQVTENNPGLDSFIHLGNQDDTSRFSIGKGRGSWTGSQIYAQFDDGSQCQVLATSFGTTLPTNTWIHVAAAVNDSTGQLRLYVNGTLQGTATLINFDFGSPSPAKLVFATGPQGSNYLSGVLDEICIYDRALSASEVTSLYQLAVPLIKGNGILVHTMKYKANVIELTDALNDQWSIYKTKETAYQVMLIDFDDLTVVDTTIIWYWQDDTGYWYETQSLDSFEIITVNGELKDGWVLMDGDVGDMGGEGGCCVFGPTVLTDIGAGSRREIATTLAGYALIEGTDGGEQEGSIEIATCALTYNALWTLKANGTGIGQFNRDFDNTVSGIIDYLESKGYQSQIP